MRRLSAKTFRLAAMTTASAAVAACGLSSATPTNSLLAGPTGQPITVGISLPLAGPQQAGGFQADGQACQIGYELWASDVNSHGGLLGRPVRLKFLNDKGDPNVTAANYRTLIKTDHVDLVLAPFSSLLTATGAAPVTSKLGYALVAGSAGAPAVYAMRLRSLFSTNVPASKQMVPLANYVASLPAGQRPATAAYPMVDDPFADPPVQTARGILSRAGIRTVYSPAPYKATSSPAQLAQDAKAVAQSGAQLVVLGSVDVPTVQAFVKEFIAQKYNPKMFIAAAGPDQGQAFLNAIGTGNADGIMVPNGWFGAFPNALSHVMVQDYIAKYGGTASDINADVAESYSAGEVLAAAVAGTRSLNQQSIITWLHKNSVQTVLGAVRFGPTGENLDALQSALIFQWQPGSHFVQVLPKGLGAQAMIRVKPGWTG